jgi:sugar lactone lactonase YvrE
MTEVELALDAQAVLAEGPVWDGRDEVLVWVDIERHLVHRFDPRAGDDRAFDVGQAVGAIVPHEDGGYVLAMRDGFARLRALGGPLELIAPVERDKPGNRMNDGKCDCNGRFWAGTMALDYGDGAGAFYCLGRGRAVERVLDSVTISNGLGWSPDDRLLYYIDSPTQAIDVFAFDPETGRIGGRRRLIEIPAEVGMPDGMTVDAEGGLWVALWGGWAVHRYTPGGALDRVVRLPVANVTCCGFAGPDLDELYITTARFELAEHDLAEQPHAGGLFRLRPGLRGMAAHRFHD